jgi:hypothetical protein
VLAAKEGEKDALGDKMLEVRSYGLTGLAAMVVVAVSFAYGDESPPTLEKSSCDLINNARPNDCLMPVETGPGIQRDSFQNDLGPVEAFHV